MSQQRGFTFLELLVTISIAAIIAAFAIPGLRDFMRANAVAGAANQLVAALSYARTEAVTRRTYVKVCRSADYASFSPTGTFIPSCTSSNGYEDGWVIWTSTSSSATKPAAVADVLRVSGIDTTGGITIRGSAASGVADLVTFSSTGTSSSAGNIVVCSAKGWGDGSTAQVIQIGIGGRIQSLAGNDAAQTAVNSCTPS